MKRLATIIYMCMAVLFAASAQDRTVENRPYTDLRPFHFGVIVGTHVQDVELMNAGPQIIVGEDGTQQETLVTTDQSRWDSGINVGVLGEFRLSQHFQFRVAPTMYFGSRHIVFRDLKTLDANGKPEESRQDMKSAYIACSADIIFAAPRFNNHRPYLMAGVSPMINLSSKTSDYLKLKRQTFALELGMGCDFYLPFFKLRPELKFVYALGNTLDTKHPQEIRDKNLLKYAQSASEAKTKMVVFSFYFE
ncbi:porin family protein [uncultured Prevotella sp.]|uniref:type IX secretion/gliding motility protein PorT/SprT n=1 Tax=uncultured Prevotella sp. TaxID=159272 RepID=UPI0027E2F9A0|nr:porin family protein [uncultured Prevotella sp.]